MSWSKEFKLFALRGNAFDTAIGVIFGVVFSNVVNSLVKDILLPPIGFFFSGMDFAELSLKLYVPGSGRPPIEMRWGSFFHAVFNFLIVSFATFLVIKAINILRRLESKQESLQRNCPECLMSIPLQAKRCGHCGIQLRRNLPCTPPSSDAPVEASFQNDTATH